MELLQAFIVPSSIIIFGLLVIIMSLAQIDSVNSSKLMRRMQILVGLSCVLLGLVLSFIPLILGRQPITENPTAPSIIPINTSPVGSIVPTVNPACKFVTKEQFESIRRSNDLKTANRLLQTFSLNNNYQNYHTGDKLPAGLVISATLAISQTNLEGLLPIKTQDKAGVFLSYSEYNATSDGLYWCIK